ncbi:vacuolar protein sorting-associated protein 13A-like [Acanthaster planci]|uniref:Vacuolar protein sorting-associated protein 13A-like n=1 Tax=Acanthaster planci TaxID=133434 RepID=A0A8B7Y1N4_ACAPL|nr:vacuolar protein sorting-associated protein 13A-like [Acanthaster planci]
MVFESLVVDLLNRFLGQYVENLDASQLKLGIWGGDAVLENLDVKEGALDELDLPVKIKSGHLGKLTLKIPWKNLYSAPVEASIEGLYVIVAPNTDIKYDAEKDAKQKFEAKQRILQHVEATKQKEKEKEEGKEKNPKGDSFVEKMATQVIKNLQVKVADIHLRYEDKTTNPDAPFAIGATLHNISLKTTDTNWKECLADASTKLIYKMLRLDCLSVYWNCNSELYSGLDRPQQQAKMKNTITADPQNTPGDFQYLVEPISLKAQLKLNTKPENDLSNPKAWLNLVIDSIGLAFRKKQFRDVMQMLDSFERMSRNEPFRKYRPTNPLKGNAKVWWHYAMNSILEETVRRRHKMWSWKHIKEHRRMLKEYKQLYVKKLDTSKPGKDLIANLEKIEKQLSVMNITMCRQQAEVEFQHLGKKRAKEKAEKGWFGGWFGGGKKAKAKKEGGDLEDIAGRFQEAMTAEEKAKLFDAIGYSEKSADPAFPKEYVGVQAHLNLKSTSVKILDEERKKQQLLNLSVTELMANFSQRPAAEAIKLEAKLDDFSVFGTPVEEGTSPQMVESQSLEADKKYSLLSLSVETNPMDGKADQRIRLNARPLKIAYDANTINQIVKFFEPPKDVHLDDLSAAAVSSLGDFTVQSSTGLQYIVDNKNILDVNIDIKASYVIIPENGINDGRGSVLIVDLGNFKMATVNEERPKGPRMENESLEELMKKAYDRFQIELQSVQVILAAEGDDWQAARELKGSPLHLLQPLDLNVGLNKCMVEDSRLAKIKITGELPDVTVDVSDFKLQELLKLGLSIPLPESSQKEPEPKFARDQLPVSPRLSPVLAVASDSPDGPVVRDPIVPSDRPVKATVGEGGTAKPTLEKNESMADMQRTNLELQFELKKVGLNLSQRSSGEDKPLISIAIHSLGTQVQMRPWDMNASVSLGSVSVQHMQFQALDGGDLYLVRTPAYEKGTDRLLSINYQKAEKSNPEFSTTYQSTEQNITVKFTTLEVVAHSDAILNMTDFADTLVASLDTGKKEEPGEASDTEDEGYLSEDEKKPKGRRVKKVKPSETIDVKVTANLDIISLVLCTKDTCLTEVYIKGLEAGVLLQKHVTTVTASLHDITVTDPTPGALHPKIVSIVDDEVFKVKAELFNGATAADSYSDMSAVDIRVGLSMGRMRAIFLNKFVMRLLSFVDQFSRAKAAAAEASANAAAAAKKTAENLQERCVRIALDIVIKAPLIIIPKGYTSDKALVADLGQLLVQNSFSIAAGTEGRELPAVLDKMEVALQSIQLSRAILEGGRIKSEVLMLEPMGLNVDLTRNLAASWYHHAPAVALFGKLRTIKVCIGPDDFALMMGILNENIAEGQPDTPSEESPAASGGKSTAAGEGVTAEAKAETAKEPQSATAPSETTEEPWEQICVDFELEGIYASLYTGKLDLRPTEGRQERVAHEALGCFAICHLGVKASIQSNQAITASAKLAKILLDDIRPGRGDGITRMLGSHGDDADDMETISVKFEQKANQDKNIDASVRNFHACVCAEFLMTVAEIFTKGLEESQVVKKEEKKKPIKAVTQTPTNTPTGTPEATEAPPVGVITIKALLDNPEIVLVADSSKKDTNALVLRTLGEVNMTLAGKTMSIKGGLQQLRINACPYLEDQRKGKMTKVLIPCNVDFNLNTPEGKGQHISVVIEQLALNISPEVIKVLSSVSQTLAPPKTETAEEKRSKAIVPADLWDAKKIADSNFWFLKDETEEALDVNTLLEEAVVGAVEQPKGEELVATINSIVIKLEASVGRRTVPMLTVDASMEAVVKDWSSKLHVDTHMTVEIACYNEKASAWEPLLEPLEAEPGQHKPWDISLEVVKNEDLIDVSSVAASGETEDEDDSIHLAPPVMTVTLSSGSMLQLTMTKTCIEMLTNLGKAFGEAMSDPNTTIKDDSVVHACTVINRTGLSLVVQAGSYYAMPTGATSDGKYSLKNNAQVGLSLATAAMATMKQKSILKSGETDLKRELSIQIEGYQEVSGIAIYRAGKVLYNLTPSKKTSSAIVISVVLDVEAHLDSRTVTIRSPLQLFNHFEMDVEIYTRVSNWTEKLGTVKGSETFVVPLNVAHSDQLLIKPLDKSCDVEYSLCDAPVMWQKLWEELQKGQGSVTFKCPCKTEGYTPFFINIVTEPDTMRFVHGNSLTAPKFTLHLYPVVILHNLMPIPLAYTLAGSGVEVKVNPTEKSQLANVDMGKTMVMISLLGYAGTDWRGEITLRPGLKEFFQLGSKGGASNELWLELGVMADYSGGYLEMAIFAPYWLINKTGLSLAYKAGNDVIEHPPDKKEPILFAYPTNKGFSPGKNKICMKVGESNWSDKFSLDAVGSTGFISCKTDEKTTEAQGTGASKPKKYSVGVQIQLSNFGMTKIVVFNPRYLLINQTEFPIRCAERYQEKLVEVQPKECIAFWPTDKKNNPMMVVMAEDSTEKSLPFLYTDPHTTVLKLDSKLGGIIVDTSVTETATVVSFESFSKGNFTVQLINHTDNMPVKYHQINVKEEKTLRPGEAVLYTWQNPTEKRELVWNVGEKDHRNDLIKAATLEQSDLELVLSLPGIGLSLVNNLTRTEVAYIGIISSGIIWQNKIRRRWRDMNGKQMKLLEDGYQKAQNELVTDKDAPPKLTKLEKDFEVDFRAMTMKQPQHRPIRRTYHTGMWAQVRTSKHQLQVHVMIHRIQIDNQMPAAIFQTVLAPIPPPKSVSAESVPKPMIEFSLMMRESEHSKVKQIKYLKLLIQEMAVKVDIGFITSLAAVFQSGQETTGMEELGPDPSVCLKWMEDDLKVCTTTFMDEEAVKVALAGNVNFFDNFHLSPLKTHVSFSLSDTGGENDLSAVTKKASVQQNAMRLILQSVGVTLTNIDDVVFKLGFFEREHQFYSQQQLQSEIVSHYANQAIKQLYVLVLGLDVIGNPFGFVRGVQTGVVDFFYEPYQGIVQGPEEFAEGVALGMRSLFGHAVGGAAGAVSRITGTLGKGLAALTMDEEYKRKRQQAINQKPATFQEGLARGGKGLVMGFVDGVTGVVKNPFQGAKKEGAKGFFKGVGKGLAGVVVKPTGGVIDFASSTFEGIRRVTDMSEDVVRLRFPRYLHLDGIVRPYEKHEAEGQNLFHQIDKGKFSQTEDYVAHMLLTADKKHYLVATDKRLILTSKGEVLGHWNVEFQYPYKDLKDTPALTEKGLQIITKEDAEKGKKKGFGLGLLKGKSGQGKMVHITDRKEAEYFISKVKEAMDKALKATE